MYMLGGNMKVIEAKLQCDRCHVEWFGLLQMTVKQAGQVEVIQWEPVNMDRFCPECAMEDVNIVHLRKEIHEQA